MFSSNLIIGLGGQGGRSVAAFRRELLKNPHDVSQMQQRGVRFEYLYIDSSRDQVEQHPQWKQYGQSVMLPAGDVVDMSVRSPLSKLEALPNISPWLGNLGGKLQEKRQVDAQGNVQGIKTGAGQLRRYGRALFAEHAQTIRSAIDNKLRTLCSRGTVAPPVCVHVFCTLGGGTGSGGLIDLLTMVNELVVNYTTNAKIMVYCYVAGPAQARFNVGYFFQNEYAALRDLNALASGTYHPFMTGGPGQNGQTDFHADGKPPVHQVFLSSEYMTGTDIQEQIEHMARACFQMIATHGSLHPDIQKGFTGEDLLEGHPGEMPGNLTQSYCFAGVAAKSWFVPISQIREMLKLEHEARVCGLWLAGKDVGGISQPPDQLANNFVVNRVFSNGYQTFLSGLIDEKKKVLMDMCTKLIKHGDREADTLNKFADEGMTYVETLHNQPFTYEERSQANVKSNQEVESIVHQVREEITGKIQWRSGATVVWGLKRAKEYVDKLIETIQIKRESLAKNLPASEYKQVEENLRAREEEWGKLGVLSRAFVGLDETMIRQHCQDIMCCLEPTLTYAFESLQKNFYTALATALDPVKNSLVSFINAVEGVQKKAKDDATTLRSSLGNVDAYNNEYETYEMDVVMMGKVLDAIEKQDLDTYMDSYDAQWQKHVSILNQGASGSVLQLVMELSDSFYQDAEKVHNAAIDGNNTLSSLLVGSIMERLAEKAGLGAAKWDTSLPLEVVESKLRSTLLPDIVKFLSHMPVSVQLSRNGNYLRSPQMAMQGVVAIGFPDDAKYRALTTWMEQQFKANWPAGMTMKAGGIGVYHHSSPEVIRVMYVPHWFPVRFATVVGELYSSYTQSARAEDGDATLYFVNLDDEGAQIPAKERPELISVDTDTICWDVELAKLIRMKDVKGQSYPLLEEDPQSDNMVILKTRDLNTQAVVQYTQPYKGVEKMLPSQQFRCDLSQAINDARIVMTHEEKKAILNKYAQKLEEARREGLNPASPEFVQIQKEYNYVNNKL